MLPNCVSKCEQALPEFRKAVSLSLDLGTVPHDAVQQAAMREELRNAIIACGNASHALGHGMVATMSWFAGNDLKNNRVPRRSQNADVWQETMPTLDELYKQKRGKTLTYPVPPRSEMLDWHGGEGDAVHIMHCAMLALSDMKRLVHTLFYENEGVLYYKEMLEALQRLNVVEPAMTKALVRMFIEQVQWIQFTVPTMEECEHDE